jgi:hypothetical protein
VRQPELEAAAQSGDRLPAVVALHVPGSLPDGGHRDVQRTESLSHPLSMRPR